MQPEFNLQALCDAARKRLQQYINRATAQHLRQMREGTAKK